VKIKHGWLCAGVVLVGLLCERAPLHAQPTTAPATTGDDDKPWNKGVPEQVREAARDLFLEGNRLFGMPLFAQAAEKYEAALGKWKHPAFYFNLAIAQLNLGQDLEARESLEQGMKHGAEPLGDDAFAEAKKIRLEVEHRLGRIRVSCQTPGAEITLDGVALFTAPGSHEDWVKAKPHEITAKKDGYQAQTRRMVVAPGALQSVDLKLITLTEAADSGRRWAVWKPWVVVAAGAAVAAAGGGIHALASRNFNEFDDEFLQLPCVTMPDPTAPGCTDTDVGSDLNGQLKRARRQQAIAVGGYLAGGALVATGVVLLYMNRPRLAEQGPSGGAPSGRVVVLPTVSPDMLGVLVSVSR